jgi:hypothetical protein
MKTQEIIEVERFLREKKGVKTVRERIEYLRQIDPSDIDPDLAKRGLKSKADLDQMIQAEEQISEASKIIGKIIGNNPVFDKARSDSVLNTIAHDSAVKDLGIAAQTAASIEQSFGPWMAEVAQLSASIEQSFGPWMAEVAQLSASIEQSFGSFEQLSSQLQEIAGITGTAQDSLRLDIARGPIDLANHLGIEEDLPFAAEAGSREDDQSGRQEERFEIMKTLLAGIEANNLTLSMLAIMTLSILKDPSALSDPVILVAIVIIWMIALGPLAKKGQSDPSGQY